MSWLFGGNNSSQSANAHNGIDESLQQHKKRELMLLERNVSNLTKISDDDYEVSFKIRNERKASIRIFFTPQFPAEKPVFQLLTPIVHPWINNLKQLDGHPDLAAWKGLRSKSIFLVIEDIIQELSTNAIFPDKKNAFSPNNQTSNSSWKPDTATNAQTFKAPQKPIKSAETKTAIPPIPNEFPFLGELSESELRVLASSEEALDKRVECSEGVLRMEELLEEIVKGNAEVAKSNIELAEKIESLSDEIELKKIDLAVVKSSFEEKLEKMKKSAEKIGSEHVLLKEFKEACQRSNKCGQKIEEEFMDGEIGISEFLERFVKERKRYHVCSGKMEGVKRTMNF
mmetsp:Transcript_6463/g.9709  ORF Transcript_6463/g.9709 Transcript_6463/m.9709 type:complete len:342 (-) Transcript_6463:17-1042(-)